MHIPIKVGLCVFAEVVLAISGAFAETEAIFDQGGRPLFAYKINAVFFDGFIIQTKDGTVFVHVPPQEKELRERIIRGQATPGAEPPAPAISPSIPAVPPPTALPPQSGSSAQPASSALTPSSAKTAPPSASYPGSAPFGKKAPPFSQDFGKIVYSMAPGRRESVGVLSTRLSEIKERDDARRAVEDIVPGAASEKELPWEFLYNEVGMLAIWFSTTGHASAEDAAISQYIAEQHTPTMLLYRLLIRPFLPRHKKAPEDDW